MRPCSVVYDVRQVSVESEGEKADRSRCGHAQGKTFQNGLADGRNPVAARVRFCAIKPSLYQEIQSNLRGSRDDVAGEVMLDITGYGAGLGSWMLTGPQTRLIVAGIRGQL
jgi:hypothetical protein